MGTSVEKQSGAFNSRQGHNRRAQMEGGEKRRFHMGKNKGPARQRLGKNRATANGLCTFWGIRILGEKIEMLGNGKGGDKRT